MFKHTTYDLVDSFHQVCPSHIKFAVKVIEDFGESFDNFDHEMRNFIFSHDGTLAVRCTINVFYQCAKFCVEMQYRNDGE